MGFYWEEQMNNGTAGSVVQRLFISYLQYYLVFLKRVDSIDPVNSNTGAERYVAIFFRAVTLHRCRHTRAVILNDTFNIITCAGYLNV